MHSFGLFYVNLVIIAMLFMTNASIKEQMARLDAESKPSHGIVVQSATQGAYNRHPSRRRVTTASWRPQQVATRTVAGYTRGQRTSIEVTTVDQHPVEIRTARAYRSMATAARGDGVTLHIVSGFRSMAHQRQLYAAYRAGRGNLAARPGFSNHQSGLALDLNTQAPRVYGWLARNANRFGFCRTVPSERWHWEWRLTNRSSASRPWCR